MLLNYWMSLLRYLKKSRLLILDITKTESNNCFIIHRFEENEDKHNIASLQMEIMRCACNLQISH